MQANVAFHVSTEARAPASTCVLVQTATGEYSVRNVSRFSLIYSCDSRRDLNFENKMVDLGHTEFRKMLVAAGLRYLHKVWYKDTTRPHGDAHVTKKSNRKLIRMTSSVERLEQNMGYSQRLCEIFEPNLVHRSRNRQTITEEHAKFIYHATVLNFEKCQYLRGRLRTTTARWLSAYM